MAFGTNGQLWPNATIPYEIDEGDFPEGSPERAEIDKAIKEWNDNTVIRLIPKVDEDDYVVFEDTDDPNTPCVAVSVGRGSRRQSITCDLEAGDFDAGNLMHEIGHAVGFNHEAQRQDREQFITVNEENIRQGKEDQFEPIEGRILTDYDCGSIMHYSAMAFAVGSEPTIVALSPRCAQQIGQRDRLSGRDVWGASLLYGIPMQFVVVWEDDSNDNKFFNILASGLAGKGRRCMGPLTINRLEANQQRAPEVGMAGNRNMVFVWADDHDGNGFFEIKMRGFGANGRQLFSQRTVNTDAAGQQLAPHVAVANDGRFVVVWQDDTDRNRFFQIKARGFESNGAQRFSQRTINTQARGQQTAPRVAIAPDGFFVVLWEDDEDGNGFTNIRMRGFNADGTERWNERQVNVRSSGQQRRPRIAMGPFGDFVVVWENDADKNGVFQIHMRAFTADGNEKFSEKTVNVVARGQQLEPDVAVDDVFRPVVVWADDRDRNGFFQIRMRGFESDGRERLSERTVNTDPDGQQRRPAIAMEANGRFIVAWEDDKDNDGKANILVRGFSSDGSELYSTRGVSNITENPNDPNLHLPLGHRGRPRVAAPAMSWFDVFNPL
jgi:hypothetical protein